MLINFWDLARCLSSTSAGNLFGVYQMTYTTGLIGIPASEMMRIQEELE